MFLTNPTLDNLPWAQRSRQLWTEEAATSLSQDLASTCRN